MAPLLSMAREAHREVLWASILPGTRFPVTSLRRQEMMLPSVLEAQQSPIPLPLIQQFRLEVLLFTKEAIMFLEPTSVRGSYRLKLRSWTPTGILLVPLPLPGLRAPNVLSMPLSLL